MNIIEETIDELNEIMERFEIKCPLKDCRDEECVREVLRTHHKESIKRVLEEVVKTRKELPKGGEMTNEEVQDFLCDYGVKSGYNSALKVLEGIINHLKY